MSLAGVVYIKKNRMNSHFLLRLVVTLAAITLTSSMTALAAPETVLNPKAQPLNLTLDDWPYPYPVKSFTLTMEGQGVYMAYMDVPAEPPFGQLEKGIVVLMHGKNFPSDYWGGVIATLSKRGYRVIVPDQIGFNRSSKPELTYHLNDLAANTLALLNSLKIGKVALVGHSMGGILAVRFARLYPERLRCLVLENPLGLEDYKAFIPPQETAVLLKQEITQTEDSYRRFIQGYFSRWRPEFERYVEMYTRAQLSPDYPRYALTSVLTYQMIYESPIVSDLPKLVPDTLLVIGQLDRTVFGRRFVAAETIKTRGNFKQLGRAAAKAIPHATLIEFHHSGHVPHLEEPELFNNALLAFLAIH